MPSLEPSLPELEPSLPGADPRLPGADPHGPRPEPLELAETETRVMDGELPMGTLEGPDLAPNNQGAPTPVEAAMATVEDAPRMAPLQPPRQLSLPARIEAILYLKGKPLTLGDLAEIASVPREEAELALVTLMADYAHRDTALEIRQEGQRYSLQLRESLGDLVQSLLPVDLSTAALRTLATIALKKRILQSDLVELRGSGAYDHIKELLAQNFIERKRQSEGRSFWLSLSEKFHRTFAVTTVAGPARPRGPNATKAKAKATTADRDGAGPGGAGPDAASSGPAASGPASGVPDLQPTDLGPEDSAWETPA